MTQYAYYIIVAIVVAWLALIVQDDGSMRGRLSVALGISAAMLFVYGLVMSVTVSL